MCTQHETMTYKGISQFSQPTRQQKINKKKKNKNDELQEKKTENDQNVHDDERMHYSLLYSSKVIFRIIELNVKNWQMLLTFSIFST